MKSTKKFFKRSDFLQNRIKSKAAWVAIAALIGFILGNYGLYETLDLTDET